MQRRSFRVAAIASGLITLSALGHATLGKAIESGVTFRAAGPAGLTIEGSTADLAVTDEGDNVAVTVPLGNLHTGIEVRDRHMKEKYLEVGKFPEAKLVL